MIREKHIARTVWTARTAQAASAARVLRSGFAAFVAGVAALCCTACINDYPDEVQVRFPDGESIALQVSLFDVIEDHEEDAANDLERMHNLRVIITHKEGEHEVIEYNRLIEFGGSESKYRYGYVDDPRLMFKIEPGSPRDKHIYLFANSEPILNRMLGKSELAGLTEQPDPEEGIYGGTHYRKIGQSVADSYLNALRNATYSNTDLQEFVKPSDGKPANGIPMSAEYDIEFNPGNTGIADVCIMNAYIVRAANKITFEFTNDKVTSAVFVKNFGLDQLATRSYLLPRVGDNGDLYDITPHASEFDDSDWIRWLVEHECDQTGDGGRLITVYSTPGQQVNEAGNVAGYEPDYYKPGPMSSDDGGDGGGGGDSSEGRYLWFPYDITNVDVNTDDHTKHIGTGYDPVMDKLPKTSIDDEFYRLLVVDLGATGESSSSVYKGGLYLSSLNKGGESRLFEHAETAPVYFLESNYHPIESSGITPDQQYTLNIDTETLDDSGTMSTTNPNTIDLTNVKSLFRNTHVKIKGTIGKSTILIWATIEPWKAEPSTSGELTAE